MSPAAWLKAFIIWLCILGLAIANGILREQVLMPVLGPFHAFLASGIILSVLIFSVACVSVTWYGRLSSHCWWYLGLFWLLLTVAFEFGFGYFLQHKSRAELLQAYMLQGGNIWPIVLLVTALSPWFAARLRGLGGLND